MTVEMKPLPIELIDALLADYKKLEDLIGQNGLLKQLTKAPIMSKQAVPCFLLQRGIVETTEMYR